MKTHEGSGEAEVIRVVNRIQAMLLHAIVTGRKLRIAYKFTRPATLQDLAKIEKALAGWIRGSVRRITKLKSNEIPDFRFDIRKAKYVDGGDHTVTVTLDFRRLLPGKRPAALIAAADAMMEKLDAELEVPASGEPPDAP
jgi:hypothetical protein